MTTILKAGQVLKGAKGTYTVLQQIHDAVWKASIAPQVECIVKSAPAHRLRQEQELLQKFPNHPSIRQLIDYVEEDPPYLILEHLECDSLQASGKARLSRPDIKFIAKNVLEALKSFHDLGFAHTDVKPDNILLNFRDDGTGVAEAKLADCGDAWEVGHSVDPKGTGHFIGAPMFRSPEAMLELRWATPTDIWSFGATLISLIFGKHRHIFKPENMSADDPEYLVHVLIQQTRFFGPFPDSYEDFITLEQNQALAAIMYAIADEGSRKPFILAQDKELTEGDKRFIWKIMQMDPRDRPTAKELLEDEWFDQP